MYQFADVPEREDFLQLAEYLDVDEKAKTAKRTAPALTPIRAQVAAQLRHIASSSGHPGKEDRQRYQALRLFVR